MLVYRRVTTVVSPAIAAAVAPVELGRAAAGEEGLVPQEGRQRVAEAEAPASVTRMGRWGTPLGDVEQHGRCGERCGGVEIYKKLKSMRNGG